MILRPKEFVRDPFRTKRKPVKDPDVLAAFANSHHFCQACGKWGTCTVAHIIGGRGGRSDEPCNLLYLDWDPCHCCFDGQYVQLRKGDMPRITLGMALSMKMQAGELTQADLDRLQELHGKRLPDLEPIPEPFATSYRLNMRKRMEGAA